MKDSVFSFIRHAGTFIGGLLVAKGYVDDAIVQEIIGGVITAIGGIWGIYDEWKATKQLTK